MRNVSRNLSLGALALAVTALAGCGGSGGGTTPGGTGGGANTGTVSYSVAWPSAKVRAQIIPGGSNSLKLALLDTSNQAVASGLLVRPNSTWTSPPVSPGQYLLQVSSFASTDGTGTPNAAGNASVTVSTGQNMAASPVLGAAASNLSISVANNALAVGSSIQATAVLSAGSSPLQPGANSITWTSSDPSVATVSSSGLVTGVKAGTCTLTATYTDVEPSLGQSPINSAPITFTVTGGGGQTNVTLFSRS